MRLFEEFIELRKIAKEAWTQLGEQEKLIWRQKAKQRKKISKGMISTGEEIPSKIKKPRKSLKNEEKVLSIDDMVPDCKPMDIAAHFALLSDSLASIGNKLKQCQDEQNNKHNVTDVLLDSLLCSLGSLLCLTNEVDGLNAFSKEMLIRILDNTSLLIPND
jgi:high mobility group protein 2-like 1